MAEQDKAAEFQRQERARSHPLMQVVFMAFPDAKLVALRQRTVAPATPSGDDVLPNVDGDLITNEVED